MASSKTLNLQILQQSCSSNWVCTGQLQAVNVFGQRCPGKTNCLEIKIKCNPKMNIFPFFFTFYAGGCVKYLNIFYLNWITTKKNPLSAVRCDHNVRLCFEVRCEFLKNVLRVTKRCILQRFSNHGWEVLLNTCPGAKPFKPSHHLPAACVCACHMTQLTPVQD